MHDLSDEERARREKLGMYRGKGLNPYRNGLMPKNHVAEIRAKWGDQSKEELEASRVEVSYAGRIMAFRHFGKAAFVQLKDRTGVLQTYVAIQDLGDGKTRATYALKGDTGRMLGLLIKGPVQDKLKEWLTKDAAEGLKARAES